MVGITVNQRTQLLGIPEWRQGTVDQANDLAEANVGRGPSQLISAFCAASAFHDACVLQFQQDQLEEFFRQILFVSDVTDADRALVVMPRQHHERLQCVQTFLGDFHGLEFTIMSIYLIDIEGLNCYWPQRGFSSDSRERNKLAQGQRAGAQTAQLLHQFAERQRCNEVRELTANVRFQTIFATCTVMLSGPPCALAKSTNARQAAIGAFELRRPTIS